MKFGKYLRDLRETRNLRQSDLANMIGVSTVYICDIEKGRRYPPDIKKLRIWIEQLSLTADETTRFYDLVGEARESPPPDIIEYVNLNPEMKSAIRRIIEQKKDYNWDLIPPER